MSPRSSADRSSVLARGTALSGAGALVALLSWLAAAGAQPDPACPRWRAAFASMPVRAITIEAEGRRIPVQVRMAETPDQQAGGFQCATPAEIQKNLILFDFGHDTHSQFHMQNVPAALDIAFIKGDGHIFSILVMQPSPTALYGPMGSFRWALEARQGFYADQEIRQGRARLRLPAP
jgi:uncharacterized membrane protein (UPF0127 family)